MHQPQNDRPPLRPRPMSAKPSSQSSSTFSLFSSTRSLAQSQGTSSGSFTSNRQGEGGDGDGDVDGDDDDDRVDDGNDANESEDNDEDESGVVDDDEDSEDGESDEFGAAAQHQRQAKASMIAPPSSRQFRPSSAPPVRARQPVFNPNPDKSLSNKPSRGDHRAAAAVSISYLKAAAEKKKARDREFALELLREETEYKKKISLKIDQANKMLSNAGSKKLFMLAPFEKLATIPIGQAHHHHVHTKSNSSHPGARPSSAKANNDSRSDTNSGAPASKSHLNSRMTRGNISSSTSNLIGIGADGDYRFHGSSTSAASKRTSVKAIDRSQIQEELKSVLAGTIELTKVLQDQLHELKLKGWNFASRANAPAAQ